MPVTEPGLRQRSLASAGWRVSANTVAAVLAFGRAVALARLIPVEAFGAYSLAVSLVTWSGYLGTLGMSAAFLHRAPETVDEERAAAVHFTLVTALSAAWAAAMVTIAALTTAGPLRLALVVLTLSAFLANLAETPRALLVRRVEHGRLAALEVLGTLVSIMVAIPVAIGGGGLVALLAADLALSLLTIAVLYLFRPVWRPRLTNPGGALGYFLRFGATTTASDLFSVSLVRLEKVWTGLVLGDAALGFYSRAYVFSGYPQRVLFAPVEAVARGGLAELAGDRVRLSRAFFETGAALARAACGIAGALALAAPELIAVVLGARWLPMLSAFRLLLVAAVLAPLRVLLSSLFVAVGRPGVEARIAAVQLAVLAVGLAAMGRGFGIAGVAVAVDAAVAIGVAAMLLAARRHVDFSLRRFAAAPALGLALGLAGGWMAALAAAEGPALLSAAVKLATFAALYGGVLVALEGRRLAELAAIARGKGRA